MSPAEPGGLFAPGDAFERHAVLETVSYGVVWEGKRFRASQAEPLAFVELSPALIEGRERAERLRDGLVTASGLADPGIVACHGVAADGEAVYLVWEGLSGMSLARAFEALAAMGSRFSTEAILRVAGGILAALDATSKQLPGSAEAPYGHGLLTPENVFLAEGQRVLVRGFGIWPEMLPAGLVPPTQARYLAASQLSGSPASPRGDLFSLGTILFELVCGLPAFDGAPDEEGLSSLRESIDERRKRSDASLLPLFDTMLACFMQGPPAAAHRGRLRKAMDTLFLEELSRERVARTLSIEDLLERARPRRAAVVKARPLALQKYTGLATPGAGQVPSPEAQSAPEPQAPAPAAAPTVSAANVPRVVSGPPRGALLALGAVVVVVLLWVGLKAKTGAPGSAPPEPTPLPLTVLVERPGGPPVQATPIPGSLVALDAPGLVRPVLASPAEAVGAHPAGRRARLELLIDEEGRVRESKVVDDQARSQAELQVVERQLAALRFQPARLGGNAVRVWMPYELRYAAP